MKIKTYIFFEHQRMKRVFTIMASITLFVAIWFGMYIFRDVKVYGHTYSADRKTLSFSGEEIDDVDGLIKNLKSFPKLKDADLGTFVMSVEDSERLEKEFPNAEFNVRTYVEYCGKRIMTDTEEIDLTDVTVDDPESIKTILPLLPDARKIDFGENVITNDLKVELQSGEPSLEVSAICTYVINGNVVREDTETLDLTNYANCEEIPEIMKLFPDVKNVDLTGALIPLDIQYQLALDYPDTAFKWKIYMGGVVFDADCEEIDIAECEPLTLDDLRMSLPLFSNLKRIDISACGATNEENYELRKEFPNIKIVWTLYMGRWSLKTDDVAFSVLIYDYKHKRLTTDDIQVLQYCTDLRALDLGHQAIRDITVIGDYLTELRVLILADNAISDLTPLTKLKHLHYLEFFVNWVSDISPLAELDELVDLNISYNYSIRDITPLLNQPKLERLWLESTSVSPADVELLQKTYPNATIIRTGEGSIDQGWRVNVRYYAMMDMWFHNYISEEFTKYDG